MMHFSGLIEDVRDLDLRLTDEPWAFSERERVRIDAHWQETVTRNPALWNGDILMARDVFLGDSKLSARFVKTDYASFVAWRDWGWPDKGTFNLFGMPSLITSDGALVYAEMAAHTLNAGRIDAPGGSLEMRDVLEDGTVDVDRSIIIETIEEVGFDLATARRGTGYVVMEGQIIAFVRRYHAQETFAALEARFAGHHDAFEELRRLVAVRSRRDITDAVPSFAAGAIMKEFAT
jgi:hypothetical protein